MVHSVCFRSTSKRCFVLPIILPPIFLPPTYSNHAFRFRSQSGARRWAISCDVRSIKYCGMKAPACGSTSISHPANTSSSSSTRTSSHSSPRRLTTVRLGNFLQAYFTHSPIEETLPGGGAYQIFISSFLHAGLAINLYHKIARDSC